MKSELQSSASKWGFTLLRVVIGWHFLYEGIVKLLDNEWSSADYLANATGAFAAIFHRIAETPVLLQVADVLNIWGLTFVGLALVFGVLPRLAPMLGITLLLLYYLSNPPFVGLRGVAGEGSYLLVNKNLVEAVALLALMCVPRGRMYGLDSLFCGPTPSPRPTDNPPAIHPHPEGTPTADSTPRRQLLRHLIGLPVLGAFGFTVHRKRQWDSLEERHLIESGADAASSATIKKFVFSRLGDLKGTMTCGRIGDLTVSRLILGGNLIGGWAHARDLLYVSDLVKAYHSDDRVINTFRLAEKCGVNTFLAHPKMVRIVRKYWDTYGGKIQYIADCGGDDLPGTIKMALDAGAHACYVQGATADRLVAENKLDVIRKALDQIRAGGRPAGIGGHAIATIKTCIAQKIQPDFWMKTLHHHNYWSARPGEAGNDNSFCAEPQEAIEVMKSQTVPWIAFKILAAGAIPPADGFAYAFNNGADFACVGMYDFQMVDDVNIAREAITRAASRPRPWHG